MARSATSNTETVWFLVGPFDAADPVRYLPIHVLPFTVGRRQELSLTLPWQTISGLHAEFNEREGCLAVRDLKSTNGTYVNGRRVTGEVAIGEDDLVQFANHVFRVRRQAVETNGRTVQDNVCDRALALVQFDKLMSERAVTPFFQPIVALADGRTVGYEILSRSPLFGLETPAEMFRIAAQLNVEVELSSMLRLEGIQAALAIPDAPHLFVNTHPLELARPDLIASLQAARDIDPRRQITLEIHEAAVASPRQMGELRTCLKDLDIGLAYDDFGAGHARLNELAEVPPDYLKFDMSLVRGIHTAAPQRLQMLGTLVQMARDLGVVALAEGIECREEGEACRDLGFELGQGFFYGRPAPARTYVAL
jgi:EAL domain-containing protein (putative c-di-GMP-specific phosphodiesterase class I)